MDKHPGAGAEPSQRDYALLHEFRYAIRHFLHFSQTAARNAGLDPQQHQLLLTLQARDSGAGVPISEIAERLLIRHHSAVELVNRAGRRGLVTRSTSAADRRLALVSLTPEGQALLRRLSAEHLAELESVAPGLVAVLGDLIHRGSLGPTSGDVGPPP
ncbi:MAG: winged helix-turn-helix transcriptional regulator [Dehalococcoidia bacterium]|nr:MarR family transcriptional regulator [Chloroflexi bacterium CFX7]MCK6564907.1 MarR family winged helix-turn-helix transcriptional regulator [Dehalococcoidia bacterium]MCL4231252.1 MarR family winged helix-turn-helix transcriptional regulator [Dehalococcoidia bacterium]NUQ56210.1 winged helix-turn-helix transcriptional regulator [Dehalococcoidia bacterium]RIL02049.1 MAG: MarR family transcriptional regulator [bacterium]